MHLCQRPGVFGLNQEDFQGIPDCFILLQQEDWSAFCVVSPTNARTGFDCPVLTPSESGRNKHKGNGKTAGAAGH